ncbi:MAG: glycosyltransferase family 39 protein [bacterium]
MGIEPRSRDARQWALLALILLGIGAVLRLAGLELHSLWLDEATSLQFAGHDTRGCLLAEVNNPPLFRLLLHGWIRLGPASSDAWVRLLPALFGVSTCVAFWYLARRILGARDGLVALALLVLNPYHLLFSQESRAYSLLLLCGVLALLLQLRLREQPERWRIGLAYCAVLTVGLYTHYQFAWLALVLTGDLLVRAWRSPTRPRWKPAAGLLWPAVAAGLLFLPWVLTFLARVGPQQRGYTADLLGRIASLPFMLLLGESAAVRQYPLPYRDVALAHLWLVIPFALAAAPLMVWGVRRLWRDPRGGRLVLLSAAVPLVALAALFPVLPLFTARYLAFLIPVACLVLAAAVRDAPAPRLARVAVGLVLGLQLVSLARYHFDPAFGRESWRAAARYAERHGRGEAVILFDKRYVQIPFDRYYRGAARRVGIPEGGSAREALLRRVAARSRGPVLLVLSHAWDTGRSSANRLAGLLCHRTGRVFRQSHGIEVHVFERCAVRRAAGPSAARPAGSAR